MVVARAVNTSEVVLVGDAEAEAEAVGAEFYPRADLVKLALAAVPADVWTPRNGVAQLVLHADLKELEVRPVEILVAHRLLVEGGRRIVPAAMVAPVVRNVVAERIGKAMRPVETAVCELVVFRVILDSRGEHRVLGRAPASADARDEHRIVFPVVRVLEVPDETVILVPGGERRVVELHGAVDVEIEKHPRKPALLGLAKRVAEAGGDAVPRIRQVARTAGELVEPVAARVDAVEAIEPLALARPSDVGLLREQVEVRLDYMRHVVAHVGRAARGESGAALDYRAPGVVARRARAGVGSR